MNFGTYVPFFFAWDLRSFSTDDKIHNSKFIIQDHSGTVLSFAFL
jgi:hypothetical protein